MHHLRSTFFSRREPRKRCERAKDRLFLPAHTAGISLTAFMVVTHKVQRAMNDELHNLLIKRYSVFKSLTCSRMKRDHHIT